MRRTIILLLVATGLAGCAPIEGAAGLRTAAADRPERQCFLPRQVVNFRSDGMQSVYLRALGGDVFEVSSAGCLDLTSSNALSITPSMGISDRLCVGDGARIAVQNPTIGQGPCQARVVRKLTVAEIEALPSRSRP